MTNDARPEPGKLEPVTIHGTLDRHGSGWKWGAFAALLILVPVGIACATWLVGAFLV